MLAPSTDAVDVVLYGATGYTGRLISRELDRRGASFLLAGRDATKLKALSESLPSRPPWSNVRLADADALVALAKRGNVLLSAAGPFATMGPPVLSAALRAGVHYADITGEQAFLRYAQGLEDAAEAAGVSVVNAVGFDVVPSDFAAALAARELGEPPESLDIGIHSGSRVSGGTRRSMAASAGKGWWFDRGAFRPGPPGRFARDFDFGAPLGVRHAAFIPWGDVATAPRSTGARQVRTFFALKNAKQLHLAWPLTDLVSRVPFARSRLEKQAARAPEGPSAEERAASRFTIVAEAKARDGRTTRGVTSGRDPYGLTAASAAHAAMLLAAGDVARTGVLTPSQAFDVASFSKALSEFDFVWRAE